MNLLRRATGNRSVARSRPDIPSADYSDEISATNFQKIKDAVADINDPKHKRHLVTSVDGLD